MRSHLAHDEAGCPECQAEGEQPQEQHPGPDAWGHRAGRGGGQAEGQEGERDEEDKAGDGRHGELRRGRRGEGREGEGGWVSMLAVVGSE